MPHRYFSETPLVGPSATLAGAEAHHLLHVLRAKAGDEVVLFDGSGAEFLARVEKSGRSSVELAILAQQAVDRELSIPITIGVALPKGDRQKWLVEKLTELGVRKLVPLETERGVAQPVTSALERLRRSVVEASKQCGRNRLLEIAAAQTLSVFLHEASEGSTRWLAHPVGAPLRQQFNATAPTRPAVSSLYVAVGPEGGFSDGEAAQAVAAGWQLVSLGERILRIETAAAFLAVAGSLLENRL